MDPTIDPETNCKFDYYKILQIDPTEQDLSKIKKAYFRQAQIHHPDKNRDNQEQAGLMFKYIQEAYTTVIDPQERAHYNRNKSKILSLIPENDEFYGIETFVNLEALLKPQANFFANYATAFEALSQEETKAALSRLGEKKVDPKVLFRSQNAFPTFGDENSPKVEVTAFYAAWGPFRTSKAFAHADIYESRGDARYRKLVLNENEKFRKDARERFEDKIREIVQYVKRRDTRIAKFEVLEKQEQKLKMEQISQEILEKKREKRAESEGFAEERNKRLHELKTKVKNGEISQAEILELERLTVGQKLPNEVLRTAQSMERDAVQKVVQKKAVKIEHLCQDKEMIQQGLDVDENEKLFCKVCKQRFQVIGEFKNHLSAKRHKKAAETVVEVVKDVKKKNKKEKSSSDEPIQQQSKTEQHPETLDEEELAVRKIHEELLRIQQEDEEEKNRKTTKKQKSAKPAKQQIEEKPEITLKTEKCSVCNKGFTSRTKLFEHIKQTGHAARK